jgi:hypothetical protein
MNGEDYAEKWLSVAILCLLDLMFKMTMFLFSVL